MKNTQEEADICLHQLYKTNNNNNNYNTITTITQYFSLIFFKSNLIMWLFRILSNINPFRLFIVVGWWKVKADPIHFYWMCINSVYLRWKIYRDRWRIMLSIITIPGWSGHTGITVHTHTHKTLRVIPLSDETECTLTLTMLTHRKTSKFCSSAPCYRRAKSSETLKS